MIVGASSVFAIHYKKQSIINGVAGVLNYIDKRIVMAYRYYKEFNVLPNRDQVKVVNLNLNLTRKSDYKINQDRIEALNSGSKYISSDLLTNKYNAILETKNSEMHAKIKLKGDNVSHLSGYSTFPSIRVNVKSNNAFYGVQKFDLQHPANRSYHNDYLVRSQIKKYGIIVPELFFVNYSKNDKHQGTALVEEIFTANVADKYSRRDGVSLKFNDDYFTDALSINSNYSHQIENYVNDFESQEISAVDKKTALKNHDIWLKATSLMRSYQNGLLKTSDIFDVDKLVLFLALAEIWGAQHAVYLHNVRFYFNPVESKFELWWWDARPSCEPNTSLNIMYSKFVNKVLQERDIYLKFITKLNGIANDIQGTSVKLSLQKLESLFNVSGFATDCFIERAQDIQRAIKGSTSPSDLFIDRHDKGKVYPQPIRSAIVLEKDGIYLEYANSSPKEVIVGDVSVSYKDSKYGIKKKYNHKLDEVRLSAHKPNTPLTWKKSYIGSLKNILLSTIKVKGDAEIVGVDHRYVFKSKTMGPLKKMEVNELDLLASMVVDYPFIKINGSDIVITKGEWIVDKFLKFPKGYNLVVDPGVTLKFNKLSGLLIQGGVKILGSVDNNVIFTPINNESKWSGVVVLSGDKEVTINNLMVDGVNGKYENRSWTGGIVINNAQVSINNLSIKNATSSDAFNIISSSFSIRKLDIAGSYSDALDIDYSKGEFIGGNFNNIGGDAVDISNTNLIVKHILIDDVSDKGVSVGEASTFEGEDINVTDANVGIAVKDSSSAVISDAKFKDIHKVGVFSYNKKPRFNGGSAVLINPVFTNTGKKLLSQNGSSIVIDKKTVVTEEVDVSSLYESGYMKNK